CTRGGRGLFDYW
nr:immunoglobulin heavy chain junction region [Macaca mulatta]MOY24267.1 immunoglobulin heavy chain junction region [Macaca mulatta]MOY27308.1 immunoglobulin heavy chain junction region [Macaca mulatta]